MQPAQRLLYERLRGAAAPHGPALAAHTVGRQMRRAERDPDAKLRAAAELAVGVDRAAVQAHELLHEREPDPRALVRAALDAFDAIKTFEQARQLMLRHADAGVRDAQQRAVAIARQAQRDAALERELQRIREQVENDLLPHLAIDEQRLVERLAVHRELRPARSIADESCSRGRT